MENKIAIVGIIVSDIDAVEKVNAVIHEVRDYVVGRLGVPYRDKHVSVISLIIDAPLTVINALSGKVGMIDGVSCKVLTTK